jgi:hypothetical protein
VGSWAHCEMQPGIFLAELCSNDPRAAMALLDRFGTLTAQVQAVQSVASAVLPENQFLDLKPLFRKYESVGKERNKIIHGLWGTSDNAAEVLLRCPPDAHVDMRQSFTENFLHGRAQDAILELRAFWEVWEIGDFQIVGEKIRELTQDFIAVSHSITLVRLSEGKIDYSTSLARIRSVQA